MSTLDPATAPPDVQAWLARARTIVDDELARRLEVGGDDPGRLREAMAYATLGAGKRLRPALVIAACEACGGAADAALPAACAIEMLHAYTLVHDDLPSMDDDDVRRGRPTVHVAFGEAIAILAGDGLLTAAFGALGELGARAGDAAIVLAARAGACELLGGQAIDLSMPKDDHGTGAGPASLHEVERLHRGKTGALFAASCELGAIAAGADAPVRTALARYGMCIGVAFQHADDRDDGEFPALATAASARMRELADEARAIAAGLGARGALLASVAGWMHARA
jgi:geranylgeranyl pyrophosphate synthase